MDRKLIITELKSNLQRVSQVVSLLESYESNNASVELDLLQKNVTNLFESYVKLKLSYDVDLTSKPASELVKPIAIIPVVETPKPINTFVEEKVAIKDTIEPSEAPAKKSFGFNFNLGDDEGKINRSMEVTDEIIENKAKEKSLDNTAPQNVNAIFNKPLAKPEPDSKTEVSANDKDLTLNERFSSLKKEVNLADRHLNTPIADLSKEISLNKKFAFVNELFDGNMDKYNLAIQNLNSVGSAEYANKYINELRATLRWDMENSTVSDFVELVERRWIK